MKRKISKWLFGRDVSNELNQLWSTQTTQNRRIVEIEKEISSLEDNVKEWRKGQLILIGLLNYLDVNFRMEQEIDPAQEQPAPRTREIAKIYKKL